MGLRDEVSAALASLGQAAATVDALADPGGAARALGGDTIVLRLAPPLGEGAPGFGPEPTEPVWARLSRGSLEVKSVALRGGALSTRRATAVRVEAAAAGCCDAASCSVEKAHTTVWLALDGEGPAKLLVAEQRAVGEGSAARAVGEALATFLGLPLVSSGPAGEATALPEPLPAIPAEDLAGLALRSEGDRVVLRSFEQNGPRATAGRNTVVGALLMVIAAALGIELYLALRSGSTGGAVAFGGGAALFALAGYAFLGVARFSARYRASSAALFSAGRDRLIVLPWVHRSGAVDARPEGRLGAAIPLGEVREASPRPRDGGWAVELDTDHGAIDALEHASEAAARYWSIALNRAVADARHPSAQTSARQRARARAREEA